VYIRSLIIVRAKRALPLTQITMNTPLPTQNTQEMNNLPNFQNPTSDSVYVDLQEVKRFCAAQIAETERLRRENDRFLRKKFAETDRQFREAKELIKANAREISGIGNSNGEVAESYFINSFAKEPKFAGQDYESFTPNLRKKITSLNLQGEYDLVLYNCSSVAIIEIKYKARKEDVETLLQKAQSFKQLFPEYANYDVYLGLAGLSVNITAEKAAIKQGIGIIKQVGNKMVINDAYCRQF
jgi:hypothetical protein